MLGQLDGINHWVVAKVYAAGGAGFLQKPNVKSGVVGDEGQVFFKIHKGLEDKMKWVAVFFQHGGGDASDFGNMVGDPFPNVDEGAKFVGGFAVLYFEGPNFGDFVLGGA